MIGRRPTPAAPSSRPQDPEARRALLALEHLRRTGRAPDALDAGPTTPIGREWRALRGRRRARAVRRTAAWVACVALLAGVAAGSVLGGRSAFAWLRANTDLFRVKSVGVAGVARLSADEVLAAAGLRVGDDILALDHAAVAVAIGQLPRVRRAVVERSWTRDVRVVVEERKPAALLVLRDTWEIDADGVLLPPDRTGRLADLPLVVGLPPDSAVAGSRPDLPGLARGLELAGSLVRAGLTSAVSEIDIANPDSLVLILEPDGVPVRVGDGRLPERRLLALSAVLNDLARDEVEAGYIDLRFAGMVAVMPTPVSPPTTAVVDAAAAPPVAAVRPKPKTPAGPASYLNRAGSRPRGADGKRKSAIRMPASVKPGAKSPVNGKPGAAPKKPAPKDPRRPHGKRA